MPGVILAFLAEPEAADAVLSSAEHLAAQCDAARINGLGVRLPPIETIMPTEEVLTHGQEARIREREQKRVEALKAAFRRWAAARPGRETVAEWFDVEAGAATALKEFGARSDVIVLKRPCARSSEPERQAIRAALFDAERPVLLVPPDQAPAPFGRRIAIAWRDDPRTIKAVLAALRILDTAEHIDVIEGVRDGAPEPRLPEIFEEHGKPAVLHILPLPGQEAFGAALLAKAHALKADMLVMGAFARTPLHNMILGGVTNHVLAHADLPVLMRH
jgi:nucleotide-binding universal stress UspA family protein